MRGGTASNIGLIGFMGTGKTTIGRALANAMGRKFYDTDNIIEELACKSIQQIFIEDGEKSFRRLEEKVVKDVCMNDSAVISFGGGVVLSKSNVEIIRHSSVVVLLRATVETILGRTDSANHRPLLFAIDETDEERIRSLLVSRNLAYETAMDFAIDTDNLNIDVAVEEILRRLKL
jgi:shikimate kinase